ncbi:TrmH family RNA methyltransferase [Niveibacterium terrae]|uniref:TrmH family RNA methyltransferase n=1 Tax=Niveibacterium terrae TaxID=3373598 RepID=UPI003A93564B
MKLISSRDNAEFKRLRLLIDSARARRSDELTVLEGAHLVRAALEHDCSLRAVFASAGERVAEIEALLAHLPEAVCRLLDPALMASLSSANPSHALLALFAPEAPEHAPDPLRDWLVLDGVQDAGNVGTLMRTAAAAGIDQVLLGPGCAQAWSPKVLRAAMGAHFCVAIHEVADLPYELGRYRGRIAATRLDGATDLYALDLLPPVAWVFGSEGQGVSEGVAHLAQLGVHIPMQPGIESLNVAAAAAICLFEQRRQRAGSLSG